jgi:hypothetical protein
MRALRRIAGDSRFSVDVQYTDLQIRALLKVPSVDCLIARQRLAYLARVTRAKPRGLLGLLHLRAGTKRLPWVMEVAKDCQRLRNNGLLPSCFPDFFDDPSAWQHLLNDSTCWKGLVDKLFFIESVTDKHVATADRNDGDRVLAYACARCEKAFASQKALEYHSRTKHGDRLDIRRFVRDSVCPACGTDYRDRLRCIAHLSDRRRCACADWVRVNTAPMPDAQVREIDLADTQLRREAWRHGHTAHIAKLPALRADGRVIGRIAA